jgi:hypothetical protein
MTILQTGEFDRLIGAVEDDQFECKSAPYQLDNERDKLELAKDVSALANSVGGVLLIGVQTEKSPTHFGDEVRRVRPFGQALVNLEQIAQLVGNWVYPPMHDLHIGWHPSQADRARGIVAIRVGADAVKERPYLVSRMLDPADRVLGAMVGYFERVRAGATWTGAERLRDLLKDGMRFGELHQRLQSIEDAVRNVAAPPPLPPAFTEGEVYQRLERARAAVNLVATPTFALTAWSTAPSVFPTLFQSRTTEVVRLLESPPRLRPGGFGLPRRRTSEILAGELRRVAVPESSVVDIWRDGLVVFVTRGDDGHLCWAMNSNAETGLRINNLALTETTYGFADFALLVLRQAVPLPTQIQVQLWLLGMTTNGGVPSNLNPHPPNPFFTDDMRPAPSASHMARTEVGIETSPGALAHILLSDLYAWFGFEQEDMPYVNAQAQPIEIDPTEIQRRGA